MVEVSYALYLVDSIVTEKKHAVSHIVIVRGAVVADHDVHRSIMAAHLHVRMLRVA